MKKIILLTIVALSFSFGQNKKIAWIINPEITTDENLTISSTIEKINLDSLVDRVVLTGNITSSAKITELKKSNIIFSKLSKKISVLPGKNDWQNSNTAGMFFRETWEDDRFSFLVDSTLIIGLNLELYYPSDNGYIPIELYTWLKESLDEVGNDRNIVLFTTRRIDENIVNYSKILGLASQYKIAAIFSSEGKLNKLTRRNNLFNYTGYQLKQSKDKSAYNLIEFSKDKITVTPILSDSRKIKSSIIKFSELKFSKNWGKDSTKNIATLKLWSDSLNYSTLVEPIYSNGKIIVADRSGLVTAYTKKGRRSWEYDLFGDVVSRPVASDGVLAVATTQGDISTINLRDGESNQTIGFQSAITAPLLAINYTGTKPRMIPKQTNSNTAIIAATENGTVHCLDLETLEELWNNSDAKDAIVSSPYIKENRIYFASKDNFIYCIDAKEGWLVWKWKPKTKKGQNILYSNFSTSNNNLIFSATNGSVYALDLRLGKINWYRNKIEAWRSCTTSKDNKLVYVKTTKDKVYVLSSKNGKLVKTINMKFGNDKLPNSLYADNKVVFVSSEKGKLYRINSKFNYKTIIDFENKPIHRVVKITDSEYIECAYDGELFYFKY